MVGFWADNGGELRNSRMEEFVNKKGIKIEFTPAFLLWLNGIHDRILTIVMLL